MRRSRKHATQFLSTSQMAICANEGIVTPMSDGNSNNIRASFACGRGKRCGNSVPGRAAKRTSAPWGDPHGSFFAG